MENRTHFHQKTKLLPKKRAKSHIPKESNLDKNEMLVGSYVMKLNDKYICEVKKHKHCFIKDDRHLSLQLVCGLKKLYVFY